MSGRVLEYYRGVFECVYVLLSPFPRVVGLPMSRFEGDTWPSRSDIRSNCEPVSWSAVREAASLPDLAAVDLALKTDMGALRPAVARPELAARLVRYAEATNLLSPDDGGQSDFLHDEILELFRCFGHDWVWVCDEFDTNRERYLIDDLLEIDERLIDRSSVLAPDHSLLWTIHWDSHFSFLCSTSRSRLDAAGVDAFEGFFCTPETSVAWSLDPGRSE